jgi:hypothetical protein
VSTEELKGRWTGKFHIRAGLASQGGTLDVTVAADGTFSGEAVDNNVPEPVTGRFTGYADGPGYSYRIHIYGPSYGGQARVEPDGSLQLEPNDGLSAQLRKASPASA